MAEIVENAVILVCAGCNLTKRAHYENFVPYEEMICAKCDGACSVPDCFVQNNFAFFGMSPALEINEIALRAIYIKTMAVLHPDRAKNNGMLTEMTNASAFCNRAFNNIITFDARAKHFLHCHNYDTQDSERGALPADFMGTMFELNDNLENVSLGPEVRLFLDKINKMMKHERNAMVIDSHSLNLQEKEDLSAKYKRMILMIELQKKQKHSLQLQYR